MAKSKSVLGRGLQSLLLENELDNVEDKEEILEIDLSKIQANPEQPRVHFDENALNELANSINEHGVLQPVILKPIQGGYILVAGERRVRASRIAGKKTIPSIIRDYNGRLLAELALLENIQRENLSPIEEAMAYTNAIESLGLTQDVLAKKVGKSRSYITNMLGLLNLPQVVIDAINQGKLTMGHARVLSKLEDEDRIIEMANQIMAQKISVRDTESIAKVEKKKVTINRQSHAGASVPSILSDKEILHLEYVLKQHVQNTADVKVDSGKIVIRLNSKEAYNLLVKKLK